MSCISGSAGLPLQSQSTLSRFMTLTKAIFLPSFIAMQTARAASPIASRKSVWSPPRQEEAEECGEGFHGVFSLLLRMDLILFQEVFGDAGILGIPVALSGIQGADALHFLGREAEIQIQVLLDVCGIGGFWECDGFLLQMPEQDDL